MTINELFEPYIEDFKDNLLLFDEMLIKVQTGDIDDEVVNSIFRVAHTIKGNSAGVEFFNVEKVMHEMEDILHEIRQGKRALDKEIVTMLFEVHDFLDDSIVIIEKTKSDIQLDISSIIESIERVMGSNSDTESIDNAMNKVETNDKKLKEMEFSLPTNDTEIVGVLIDNCVRGYNVYRLFIEYRQGCQMKNVRNWMTFEQIDKLATLIFSKPERVDIDDSKDVTNDNDEDYIEAFIISDRDIAPLKDEILVIVDIIDVKVDKIEIEWLKKEKHRIEEENIKYDDKKNEEIIAKEEIIPVNEMKKAKTGQPANKEISKENAIIRVPINKVDSLMDMLGELLILNAQMEQKIFELHNADTDINNIMSRSAKLIRSIQGLSLSLRMVEIKPTLHRLTRIARDTAVELNKKIRVEIEGEETEIDRSASEKLFDPLMHLVRNAVSHGIESENDRIKAGKDIEGRVTLRAYSKRGNVYIEVEDDGGGINVEKVFQKAKNQGLTTEGKDYSTEEIIKFIFHPGFSTQEEVNNISGRGVGMNVVESEIGKMGGRVDIISREGIGSTFIVRIPMNLVVVNGTIIEVAGGRYILPTLFIKEFFIPEKESWVSMQGKNKAIRLRDSIIPLVTSAEIFGEDSGENVGYKNVIILELEQKYIAFPVDRIISRQEIVSKPLDREFSTVGFASGLSILGDGRVSVILDVEAIFKMVHN